MPIIYNSPYCLVWHYTLPGNVDHLGNLGPCLLSRWEITNGGLEGQNQFYTFSLHICFSSIKIFKINFISKINSNPKQLWVAFMVASNQLWYRKESLTMRVSGLNLDRNKIKWKEWLIVRMEVIDLDRYILHERLKLKHKVIWLF